MKQRTIKEQIHATGVGLHTGRKVNITLRPAAVNTGIIFRRVDLTPCVEIKAHWSDVKDTRLSSTLVNHNNIRVGTVEHVMAALAGLGIDNLYIDIDADEVPIMDGSAGTFVYLLQSAGIQEQKVAKRFIKIKKPIVLDDGDKWIRVIPFDGFVIDFSIEFSHPAFKHSGQRFELDFSSQRFVQEISRARTFGFMKDVEWLRSQGLARGGSVDNAIVLDERSILNKDGLRYEDEFVRHKILDAIGDLYLMGAPLLAKVVAHKSGHAFNNQLVRTIFADASCWEYVTFEQEAPSAQPATWQPATESLIWG